MPKNDDKERIYQMLYKCNRPTSKAEVMASFKGEIASTNIQEALDKLEKSGRIVTKTYVKTKIYLVNQDMFQNEADGELEDKIEAYAKESEDLKGELVSLNNEIEVLDKILSIEQLKEKITSLMETTAANETKLKELKSGGREISKKDMADAAKAHTKTSAMLKKVKRIFNEILEALSEGMDMKKAQLYEELGIEV